MRFFTEQWYMKFYGSSPYALMDNKALIDELMPSYHIAKAALYPEFLKLPGVSEYKKCDFHDSYVKRMELISGNLIMHMDTSTSLCYCAVDRLIFTNVVLKNVPDDYLTKSDLDWFQSEEFFEEGRYQIGILFRDGSRLLPYPEGADSPEQGVKLGIANTDFPAPYVMEFSAENIIVEKSIPAAQRK